RTKGLVNTGSTTPPLRAMLRQGGLIQAANLLQLLNYRLAYYLIEYYQGLSALGVYSVGTQLSESAWIAPKSIGTVLYTRVSNASDGDGARRLTLTSAKVAVILAGVVVVFVLLVPDTLYQVLFGREIQGIAPIVLLLAPGILSMAVSQAFSHYFSGTGANQHNLIGSGIGVIITVLVGTWAIPIYGLAGAAATASLAYASNVTYQTVVFLRTTRSDLSDLLPSASDLERARGFWEELRGRIVK
ncbi:MAG: polysaccharide biosynthesis C-terminal domain-containing protein, partial [Flavobacteriales bacterium]|nr:polysaccharide biosynthesis C-terminal domain-containing protein [Flavobacteriales bacterium]